MQATEAGGRSLPDWLRLDPVSGVLEGVPGEDDVGEVYIALTAIGQQPQLTAKDYFALEVLPHSYYSQLPSMKVSVLYTLRYQICVTYLCFFSAITSYDS